MMKKKKIKKDLKIFRIRATVIKLSKKEGWCVFFSMEVLSLMDVIILWLMI